MNQSKNQTRMLVLWCVALGVFHVVILFLPLTRNFLFWLAYAFDVVAIIGQIPIMSLAFKNGQDAKSRFYGFPIARVGLIYLVVQFIAGTVVMLLCEWVPLWLAMILFVCILAFAIVGVIGTDTMRDKVEKIDAETISHTQTMRELSLKLKQLSERYPYSQLSKLVEEIRYSDPVSSDALRAVEERLSHSIDALTKALPEGNADLINRLIQNTFSILNERNQLCKQMKGR